MYTHFFTALLIFFPDGSFYNDNGVLNAAISYDAGIILS